MSTTKAAKDVLVRSLLRLLDAHGLGRTVDDRPHQHGILAVDDLGNGGGFNVTLRDRTTGADMVFGVRVARQFAKLEPSAMHETAAIDAKDRLDV